MKLVQVKIENFRGYADEVTIDVDGLTMLVGRNDAGKSTVLEALDIFFNDEDIEGADRNVRTGREEVRISCVFEDLPRKLVIDEQYQTDLASEYMVRSDGRLEIRKIYNCSAQKGKLVKVCAAARHPGAEGIDGLLSLKVTELRAKYRQMGLNGANETIKAELRREIWRGAPDLELTEKEIDLTKDVGKDIWEQIQKSLPIYALFKADRPSTDQDEEAQDPLKTAIKEAFRERQEQLDELIRDVTSNLSKVLDRTVEKISEMSPQLAGELRPSVKVKNWDSLFNVSLTGEGGIPMNKRGSGARRLVLVNFFRAKAEEASVSKGTGVIYAIEEPETSQHPNHQLMLLDALEGLVESGRCQVILTTHTPTLARKVDGKFLRLISKNEDGNAIVESGPDNDVLEKIKRTLGVLPDHDVKLFLGVEGKHDISFMKGISKILSSVEEDILNLEDEESAGRLVFVPLGGSSLELWISRLSPFQRPEFYLTDRDNEPPLAPKYQASIDEWNQRGCTAWVTSKRELENYLHVDAIRATLPEFAHVELGDFDDVPRMFAEVQYTASGAGAWADLADDVKKKKESNAKKRLNGVCVSSMTAEMLSEVDSRGEIRGWLRALSAQLMA